MAIVKRCHSVLLIGAVWCSGFGGSGAACGYGRSASDAKNVASTALWNVENANAPLLTLPEVVTGDLNARLNYPGGRITLPLSNSLYYDPAYDWYLLSATEKKAEDEGLLMLQLRRVADAEFYRTVRGPYLELEDGGPLKTLSDLDGTKYLFARMGDGEWHCVSIHDSTGRYLLIDYRGDGLIERLRDGRLRTVVLTYKEGLISSVTQTWNSQLTQHTQTAIVVEAER